MYTFFITTTVYDALADLDDDSFSSIEGEMIIGQVDAITEKEAIKNFTSSIAMQNLKENYGINEENLEAFRIYSFQNERNNYHLVSTLMDGVDCEQSQFIIKSYERFKDFDLENEDTEVNLSDFVACDQKVTFDAFMALFNNFLIDKIVNYLKKKTNDDKKIDVFESFLDSIYIEYDKESFIKISNFTKDYEKTSKIYYKIFMNGNDDTFEKDAVELFNIFEKEYDGIK